MSTNGPITTRHLEARRGTVQHNATQGKEIVNWETMAGAVLPSTVSTIPHVEHYGATTETTVVLPNGGSVVSVDNVDTANGLGVITYDAGADTFTLSEAGLYEVNLQFGGATTSGTSTGQVSLLIRNTTGSTDPYIGVDVLATTIHYPVGSSVDMTTESSRTMFFEAGTVLQPRANITLSAADTYVAASTQVAITKVK